MFKSYADCEAFFLKARFPAKGKPIKSIGRMFKGEGFYSIRELEAEMCRIYPDDTVEFTIPAKYVRHANFSYNVTKMLPIIIHRYKTGKYRIGGSQVFNGVNEADRGAHGGQYQHYWPRAGWQWLQSEAPQYFKGIKFNLLTGEPINDQPDEKQVVDVQLRRGWLRDLRWYKKRLKSMVKMGVFDHIDMDNYTGGWEAANLVSTPLWQENLFQCMKNRTFPPDITEPLVMSLRPSFYQKSREPSDREALIRHIDAKFDSWSVGLRGKYGVFKGSLHVKR